ncbi:MAG: helix-turn-helix domain-containing protein [Anaerolineaceae bacterium]
MSKANKTDKNSLEDRDAKSAERLVGCRVRNLRTRKGLSLRELSALSGLNINTLCMIENGKTSPAVSTLQQLAMALDEPIVAFFETEPINKTVVYTSANQRPQITVGTSKFENLGKDLEGNSVQPFVVTLKPEQGISETPTAHTGFEFVYCLSGELTYSVEGAAYVLTPGDSLLFQAHLPHYWSCHSPDEVKIILIFIPTDEHDLPGKQHFA